MTALPPGFDPKTTPAGEAIAIGDTEPSASADGNESEAQDASGKNTPPHDLKGRTMRGALVSAVLARLLSAEDFGLVAMVNAFTGFLDFFRGFGLSMAAVSGPFRVQDVRAGVRHA
jgi:Polysaccharide biosynthesis protein